MPVGGCTGTVRAGEQTSVAPPWGQVTITPLEGVWNHSSAMASQSSVAGGAARSSVLAQDERYFRPAGEPVPPSAWRYYGDVQLPSLPFAEGPEFINPVFTDVGTVTPNIFYRQLIRWPLLRNTITGFQI